MSNNMPKPWIKKTVLSCLDEEPKKAPVSRKNILTQVIDVFPEFRMLIINDKEFMISVALTEDCVSELDAKDVPLKSLKNCIISLQDWHVSDLLITILMMFCVHSFFLHSFIYHCNRTRFHSIFLAGVICDRCGCR